MVVIIYLTRVVRSQLRNDLWRLEQWVQYAESVLSSLPASPPHHMDALTLAIQEHRDLLLDLDCHRNLLSSLACMQDQLDEDCCARLDLINTKWPQLVDKAASWQLALQTALSQVGQQIVLGLVSRGRWFHLQAT